MAAALANFNWLRYCLEGMLRLKLKKDKSSNYISIGGYGIDKKNIIIGNLLQLLLLYILVVIL